MSARRFVQMTCGFVSIPLFCLFGFAAAAADEYTIDPVHSSITFKVKHLGVSYVHGRFNEISGMLRYDDTNTANFSVTVRVAAGSVDTSNGQRDAHLRSADFFDVQRFPTIEFNSTSVRKQSADTYVVSGDLSLHGVTRPLEVEVVLTGAGQDYQGNHRIGFETDFAVERSNFGMDKMLTTAGDQVRLSVGIEGVRK